ncbi:MAG TPA: cbb3-type cytochrome c oxidase subunit I [Verrucomicrobiae bacterium]
MNASPASAPLNATDRASVTTAELDASCRWPLMALLGGAAFWLFVSSVFALIASIKFHGPDFLADHAWLTYGRVRPAAWNALIYGGAMPAGLAVALWMLARLGGAKLSQPLLAFAGAKLWNLGVLAGVLAILAGGSTGFEWLEFPWYSSVLVFLGYALIGVSALATTHRRTVREFYPSQWFLLAALFWFPWIYSTANLLLVARPVRGVAQAVIAWWYAANLHSVWFVLVGLAMIFYFVPKVIERPLHSRYLALVTFWGVVLFGSWSGIPDSAPLPAWIPTLSTVAAVMALVPLLATFLNYRRTVKGKCSAIWSDPAIRFVGFGFVAYFLSALMDTAEAIPATGHWLQFTWFIPAQHHLAIYGFVVMAATGGAYYLVPRITGLPLCARCVAVHFWVAVLGIALTVLPLAVGGIVQGLKFNQTSLPIMDVVNATLMMLRVSTLGEALVLFANFIFVRNVVGTLLRMGRQQVTISLAAATAPAPVPEAVR